MLALCVCVCVCACVRACVRTCVCVCAHGYIHTYIHILPSLLQEWSVRFSKLSASPNSITASINSLTQGDTHMVCVQ